MERFSFEIGAQISNGLLWFDIQERSGIAEFQVKIDKNNFSSRLDSAIAVLTAHVDVPTPAFGL